MIQGNVLLSGQGSILGQPVRQLTNQGDRNRTSQQISDIVGEGGASQVVVSTIATQGNAGFSGQTQTKGKYKLILPEVFKETFEKEGENRWRQQNSDITDYFNYGFCESTFQAYANKVRTWRGKFPVSEDYDPNKSELSQFNDKIPLEYGGSCSPFDEGLLETPQNFNIFLKNQFIDVVLDEYVDSYSQVMTKYIGQQRADFMELMQKRYILSKYVEKQSTETTDSENEGNDMGGRTHFFQNNLSQYSVSENYAEYKQERRKNIDFIALHAQIIHNISQKNDSIHPNDAEKVYFLHDIFKNEMGIAATAFNAVKPTGSSILANDTSKLPNNALAKVPAVPPFMQRSMMPFQQPLMQPFSQQYFGQLLKNQMAMGGGQGYFPMGRNPYFMGGLQGMMNGMRGGMAQMGMMGFTGNMKQQQQMMNMQNQFYQMSQEDDFGGGYEQQEGEGNDGMYPNDRNEGNSSSRGGFNGRTDFKKSSYQNNNSNEEKSRNRESFKNTSKNNDSSRHHRKKSSNSSSRSRSRQTKYDSEKYLKNDYEKDKRKDKNDEGHNFKNDSKRDKKDDDKRTKTNGREENDERDMKRHAGGNKERKRSQEKKKDRKEGRREHEDSSKSRKRNASSSEEAYSKKRDSNKSKKRDVSKSKKNDSHKDKRSYSNEKKAKKDVSLEKIISKPNNKEPRSEIAQNTSSSQSILDRIQKKVKPQIEITKSRERSRSKDKDKQNKKQDTANSLSSGISLPGESKEKSSKEDILVDQSNENDKTTSISVGSKKRDDSQKQLIKTSSSSNNLRQAGKEESTEDKKHATHPNFFSNYFSALKKNTSDKFEDNSNQNQSNGSKNKHQEKKHKNRNRSESSQNSRSSSSTRKKSRYTKHNSQRETKR